jgi:Fuc2NAc and GlcNAc transferase
VLALIIAALAASTAITWWLRNFALRHQLVDVPNSRSSHHVPTPRGGGLAIVIVMLMALPVLAWRGVLSAPTLWAFLGAGVAVAVVGWIDDHGHIAARWRLLVHSIAAIWALAWLGGLPALSLLGTDIDSGWVGYGLAGLYLVWLLNLYNFMDGIDGIAAIEAITVCLGGVVLYWVLPGRGSAWLAPLLLATAAFGFLFWNFPRARIFMGDTGSGFIGIMLGLLSLEAGAVAPELFWGWLVLLGAFVVDATLTLIRRVIRGDRVYQAHRSHAYQHAARRFGSHIPISLAFGLVNVIWLLPIAVFIVVGAINGAIGMVIAYAPLLFVAWKYGAGLAEDVYAGGPSHVASDTTGRIGR